MSNQGDILNYSPDLNIYSTVTDTINYSTSDYSATETATTDTNKSISVREFECQLPSTKVANAVNLIDTINTYLSTIESSLTGEYAEAYFSSSDDEEKAVILSNNQADLEKGSTSLEVYAILEKISAEVKSVLDLYITCMFGKDVDVDVVTELVSAYLSKISQFETSNQYEKINYFGLYYDTQISYLFGNYITALTEVSAELSFISDKQKSMALTDASIELFKNSFDKLNTVLDNDTYNDTSSSTSILISMKNIFLLKQQVNSYLEVFSTLYSLDDGLEEIQDIKQENIDDLETKLDNLIKTLMYSSLVKNDICTTLQKKANYRSFFVT